MERILQDSVLPGVKNSVDWTEYFNPVYDQLNCNSCYAAASLGAIEAVYKKKYSQRGKIFLSVQEIIDCSTENSGCNGGQPSSVMEYVKEHGVAYSTEYPYEEKKIRCRAKYYLNKIVKKSGPRILESLLSNVSGRILQYSRFSSDPRYNSNQTRPTQTSFNNNQFPNYNTNFTQQPRQSSLYNRYRQQNQYRQPNQYTQPNRYEQQNRYSSLRNRNPVSSIRGSLRASPTNYNSNRLNTTNFWNQNRSNIRQQPTIRRNPTSTLKLDGPKRTYYYEIVSYPNGVKKTEYKDMYGRIYIPSFVQNKPIKLVTPISSTPDDDFNDFFPRKEEKDDDLLSLSSENEIKGNVNNTKNSVRTSATTLEDKKKKQAEEKAKKRAELLAERQKELARRREQIKAHQKAANELRRKKEQERNAKILSREDFLKERKKKLAEASRNRAIAINKEKLEKAKAEEEKRKKLEAKEAEIRAAEAEAEASAQAKAKAEEEIRAAEAEATAQAKAEAEIRAAEAEAEAAAKAKAEEKAKADAQEKAEAEERARAEAQAIAEEEEKAEAEALAKEAAKALAKVEAAALLKAQEEAEIEERARVQAEEEARIKAQAEERVRIQKEEAKAQAEEQARIKAQAEEEARIKAEEDARIKAQAEAARIQAENEAAAKELAKAEEEARIKAQAEEEARIKAEAEEEARIKAQAEEDARIAEEEARIKAQAEEEARIKAQAEEEARIKAQAVAAAAAAAKAEEEKKKAEELLKENNKNEINGPRFEKLKGFFFIKKNVIDVIRALQYGPVVTAHFVSESFKFYESGVFDGDGCEDSRLEYVNHASVIVGYDLTAPVPYFKIRNTWADDWGEKGYYRMKIGDLKKTNPGICLIAGTPFMVFPYLGK